MLDSESEIQENKPPLLIDDKESIQGSSNIIKYREKMARFKEQWDKFQSDTCYSDENWNVE